MLFGQKKINEQIKIARFLILIAVLVACNKETKTYRSFITPESGAGVAANKDLAVKILFGADGKVDSVVYQIDAKTVLSQKDTAAVQLKTTGLKLGNHIITAKIYGEGKTDELTTNINILAAKAPQEYGYKIIRKLPHDTASYVEGLEFHDGYFYESAGEYGHSSLRRVEVSTGKVVQQTVLDKKFFGEGITLVGDKIIQLTYQEKTGFVYDKNTFKQLKSFPYTTGREGWGLAFDGEKILNTDGSNTIFFLDKNDYHKIGSIDVFDHLGPIDSLNELEVIDGKIYANVYTKNEILIIDPKTGAVEGRINLEGLLPANYFTDENAKANNVLNGIAYDKATKRLFVAGKKWPTIFQIELVKK